MNKSNLIYIAVFTTIIIVAYGFNNERNLDSNELKSSCVKSNVSEFQFGFNFDDEPKTDFMYNVDSRFIATVTKDKLFNAKSIFEIYPKDVAKGIKSIYNVKVVLLPEGEENVEIGDSDVLNADQLKLLQTADYSTNFFIRANYQIKNPSTGNVRNDYLIYYLTVIPENEAEFTQGHVALMDYLQENSKKETENVVKSKLRPGKVGFTVSEKGKIVNVKLESTSGYTSIDNKMMELITKIPGKWNPATNSKGVEVAQVFFFSFGLIGC